MPFELTHEAQPSAPAPDHLNLVSLSKDEPPKPAKTEKPRTRQSELTGEAAFTPWTRQALLRDADQFQPVRDEAAKTTTYMIVQTGLSDRVPGAGDDASAYKREIKITVPDGAHSLKDCVIKEGERKKITDDEFNALITRDIERQDLLSRAGDPQEHLTRSRDLSLYTHGIRTSADDADFDALALQLTQGRTVVNVDWATKSNGNSSLTDQYDADCAASHSAAEKLQGKLDNTIHQIGAEHTNLIAFSHGAMFDLEYLQHRQSAHAQKVHDVILTHPDITQKELSAACDKVQKLFSQTSQQTFVIGSPADTALYGAYVNSVGVKKAFGFGSDEADQKECQKSRRIGDGCAWSETNVKAAGGTYVQESIPPDQKEGNHHFVHMDGIAALINIEPDAVAQNAQSRAKKYGTMMAAMKK